MHGSIAKQDEERFFLKFWDFDVGINPMCKQPVALCRIATSALTV